MWRGRRRIGSADDGGGRQDQGSDEDTVHKNHRLPGGTMHTKFPVQFIAGHDGLLWLAVVTYRARQCVRTIHLVKNYDGAILIRFEFYENCA